MKTRATLGTMNPIALIEATAASRGAMQGALATDPVAPSPQAIYTNVNAALAGR
jgi:hypothetical protein